MLILFATLSARGAIITWTNLLGGNWNATNNWNPHLLPGPADTAVITNSAAYTVTLNVSASLAGLVLGAPGGALTQKLVVSGQMLTLNGQATVTPQGQFDFTNGILAGAVMLAGTASVSGGLLTNTGSLTVSGTGVLNLGTNTFSLSGPLTNNGTVNWQGAALRVENNNTTNFHGVICNQPGAQWNIQGNQPITNDFGTGYEIFHNAGTLTKTNSAGTSVFYVYIDNNGGTVQAQSGTLLFSGGSNLAGSFQAVAGSAIDFAGGNYFWSGPTTNFTGNVQFTGGSVTLAGPTTNLVASGVTLSNLTYLTGAAWLTNCFIQDAETIAGTVNWAGGVVTNTGSLTVAGSGVLNLIGNGTFYLAGPLTNNGTVNWQGTSVQVENNNTANFLGAIWNQPGAQWNILGNQTLTTNFGTGYEIFHNAGAVSKANSSGPTVFYVYLDNNGGTVQAQSGALLFSGGSNLAGSFQAAAGTVIDFAGGNYFWSGPTTNFSGNVQFTGGSVTLTGGTTNLVASGVTISNLLYLTGSAWLTNCFIRDAETIAGMVNWAGGVVTNLGSLTVAGGSALNFIGASSFYLAGPLTNYGTVNWQGAVLQVENNNSTNDTGAIWNQPGAQWNILVNQTLGATFGTGYEIFHNVGTLTQTNAAGSTSCDVYLDNAGGTVQVASGTLLFYGGSNLAGGFQAATGAAIDFNGGNYFLGAQPTNFTGNVQFTGGSLTLTGSIANLVASGMTISNLVYVTGTAWLTNCTFKDAETLAGTLYCSGASGATLTRSGSLTVSGAGVLNLIGMTIAGPLTNNGTVNWLGGQLRVENNTTNYLGVIWNQPGAQWNIQIQSNQTLQDDYGPNYEIFHNAGLLLQTNAAGSTTFNVYLDNAGGTVLVQSGTLRLAGGSNLAGGFQAPAGAAINFSGGNFTYSGTPNFAGNVQITGGAVTLTGSTPSLAASGVTLTNLAFVSGTAWLTNCTISDAETVVATVYWAGGYLNNRASLTVAVSGTLNFVTNTFYIEGPLTNNGAVNWVGGLLVVENDGTTNYLGGIWNQPGAQWSIQIQNNQTLQDDYGSNYAIFHNAGLLFQTNATVTTTFYVYLDNTGGTVQLQSGTLQLAAGGKLGGSFSAAPGAAVDFTRGNFICAVTPNFSGNVQITGGTVTITHAITNLVASGVVVSNLFNLDGAAWLTNCFFQDAERIVGTVCLWAGTLTNSGSLTVAPGGVMNLAGNDALGNYFSIAGPLTNNGTVNWLGGELQMINDGTTNYLGGIWNQAGAQWNILSDQTLQGYSGSDVFRNAGTLTKTNSTGTTYFSPYLNNTGGAVEVASGTIEFEGGCNLAGGFLADPGAAIDFGGGNYSLSGPLTNFVGTVQFTGGNLMLTGSITNLAASSMTISNLSYVSGTAWLTNCYVRDAERIVGTVYWAGGAIFAGGSITVAAGGVLDFENNTYNAFSISGPLTNNGTVNWQGGSLVVENNNSTYFGGIWNQSRSRWNLQCSQSLQNDFGTGYEIFHNAGILSQADSTLTTTLYVYLDNNGGTVTAAGTLQFVEGSNLEGSFSAAPGGAIDFISGNFFWSGPPTNFTGNVQITGGSVTLTTSVTNLVFANVTISNLAFVTGTAWLTNCTIQAAERIVGTVYWAGGTLSSSGSLTVAGSGVFNLNGGTFDILGPLTNHATVNWMSGTVFLGAVIWNQAGAQWSIEGGLDLENYSVSEVFHNAGTLIQTGAGNTTYFQPYLDNAGGTVVAAAGTLQLSGGCNLAGSYQAASGAAIDFTGGNILWSGTPNFTGNVQITGGTVMIIGSTPNLTATSATVSNLAAVMGTAWLTNCAINGAEQISNLVYWSGGEVNSGGSLTVTGNGMLNLVGSGTFDVYGSLTNNGTVNWLGGGLEAYSPGSIWNQSAGQWNLQGNLRLNSLYYGVGVFHNAGILTQSGAGSATTIYGYLDNANGMVQIESGTISLMVGEYSLTNGTVDLWLNASNSFGSLSFLGGGLGGGGASVAALAGTLAVTVGQGYAPQIGDTFPLATYKSYTGSFTGFNLPSFVSWQTNYGSNAFTLSVAAVNGVQTVVTWTNPASIPYGAPLTTNQLNASANVSGSFAYNPSAGQVLDAGSNTLSVTFTPSSTNYNTGTVTVLQVVAPGPLTVTVSNASRTYGQTNPVFAGMLAGVTNGDAITASYACSAVPLSPPTNYPIVPVFADPAHRLGNYVVITNAGALTVLAGPPPTLTGISPASGLTNGGLTVTLSGSGFELGAGVTLGGRSAASVVVNSGTQITALTPSGPLGPVNVVMTNPDSSSATLTNGFSYIGSAPVILTQPTNLLAVQGGAAVFQVNAAYATGYQWWFNGVNLTNNGQVGGANSNVLALTGVQPANVGNYRVLATNAYGSALSSSAALSLLYTNPAAISAVATNPSMFGVAITWQTDVPTYGQVAYGTTTNYTATNAPGTTVATSHSVTLSGLTPNTLYHFDILAVDSVVSQSGDLTFSTLPDTIPPTASLAYVPATICALPYSFTWSGYDEVTPATNLVYASQLDSQGWSAFGPATNLVVSQLADGSHQIAIEARDAAGNVSYPNAASFYLDTAVPSITSFAAVPSDNACVVTWQTVQPTSGSVGYGTNSAYGQTNSWGYPATSHSLTLSGLSAATVYHFQVTATDPCGRQTVSADTLFTTPAAPILEVVNVTAPTNVWTGGGFEVAWTDTNAGPGAAAGAWADAVYLCLTNHLNSNTDLLLGEFSFNGGLNPGQSAARSQLVTIYQTNYAYRYFYICVMADAGNAVYENVPKTNNVGVSATNLYVNQTLLPALAVAAVDAPANALGGQPVTVSWTVCNQGGGATDVPFWYDHVYLSTTTNLTGEIADYGEFANPYYLEPGECYDQEVTAMLPIGLGGNCYFIVKADDTGSLPQSTTAGNTGFSSVPMNLQLVSAGFLHVVSIQVAPAPPTVTWGGQQINCTYIVQNTGQTPVLGAWDDRITLSPLSSFINGVTAGFAYENDLTIPGPLAPGATYTNSAQFTLPVSVAGTNISGTWYVVPVVDIHYRAGGSGLIVGGIGRDELSAPLDVSLPPAADLVMTSVAAPTNAVAGQEFTVSWTVANEGVYQTSVSGWNDAVYAATNPVFDMSQSVFLGAFPHYGILNLGASYTNSVGLPAPTNFLAPGSLSVTNYLFVVADVGDAVIELTKTNNVLATAQPLVVQLPPASIPPAPAALAVTRVSAPATVVAGAAATVAWTVVNLGGGSTSATNWTDSVFFSPGPLLDPATEIDLADITRSGTLAAGASYSQTQTINLPNCVNGLYYVIVAADRGNAVKGDGAGTNQMLATASPITIWPTTAARLTVGALNAPASAQAGSPLAVAWTVQNLGNSTTTAPWDDAVYLSPTAQFVRANSLLLGVYPHAANLAAKASYQVSQAPLVPLCYAGNYFVAVVADLGEVVNSIACFTNNVAIATNPVAIQPGAYASLQAAGIAAPAGVNAGAPWAVTWTVTNAGPAAASAAVPWTDAVYASLSTSLDTNALLLGRFLYTNGLAAGGSYQQTQTVAFSYCLSGSYNIFVVADVSNVVNGASCLLNNQAMAATPILVNYGLYPDLVVAAVTNPVSGFAGQPFTVSWSVTNNGLAAASGPWLDSVYLTTRTTFNSTNSVLLGTYPQTSTVPVSGGYTQSASFTMPNISGTFSVVVVIDSGGVVPECLPAGANVAYSSATASVPVALYPDLNVTSVLAPGSVSAGQSVNVSWVVTNEGTEVTPLANWNDAVYLSPNQGLGAGALRLGSSLSPGWLAVGQSYTNTATVLIPAGLSGPYYLLVLADSGGSLFEHLGFNDSLGWTPSPILVNLPAPSDLAATGASVSPASGLLGTQVTMAWNVTNNSGNSILATWTDEIYLSTNTVWDLSAVLVAAHNHSELAPNGSYGDTWSGPLPALTPGIYYAVVRTDARDTVNELTLTNNSAISATTIKVDVPVLALGQPVTNLLTTGAAVYYKFSAPAGSTLKIAVTGSVTNSANELFIRYAAVPDLGDYDFLYSNPLSPNQQIVIPAAQAGYYYLMLRGASEPGGPLPCVVEAVLVPLAITGVSASHIGDNGQVTLAVNGAKFQPGATVQLVSGAIAYNAATNIFGDPANITARFLFTNAVDGIYDLVLANPDGSSARVSQAVTIEPALPLSVQITQGVVNQEPLEGQPFNWNGAVVNSGNVDVPYLTLAVQDSLGYPMRLTPPPAALLADSNSADNAESVCSFVVRNLAVGVADNFSFVIPFVPSCGYYIFAPLAQTKADYLVSLATQGESLREYLLATPGALIYYTTNEAGVITTNAGTMPAALAAAVTDTNAFAQVFVGQFVPPGLVDPVDLAAVPPPAANSPLYLSSLPASGSTATNGLSCMASCLLAQQAVYWAASEAWGACVGFNQSLGATQEVCFLDYKTQLTAADASYGIGANIFCSDTNAGGVIIGNLQNPCSWLGYSPVHYHSSGGTFITTTYFFGGTFHSAIPIDPNQLQGPAGYGAAAFVGVQAPWPYTIYFENDSNATAFASQVAITNTLDPSLDIRTFRISQIAIGNVTISVPTNQSFVQVRVPAPAPNPSNVVVDVTAGVDVAGNNIFCTMNAIDLNTGQLVANAQEGVLPPNTTNHIGQGYLVYSILPKAGVGTGTVVTNQASIVFGNNDPIATNPTTNTVDALPPASAVAALPAAQVATNLIVAWSGTDDPGGSGVAGYDVYYRVNAGPWQTLLTGVTYTNTTFAAQPGNAYSFYSRAQDNAGNLEPAPLAGEAITFVSTNLAPNLRPLTNQWLTVGQTSSIPVQAANPAGTALTYSLVNAPAGAGINPTNGTISWTPLPSQAGSTNLLTVQASNAGPPPLSDSESFLAVVGDYASLNLGSGSVQVGGDICLPLTLVSSAALTNLNFTLAYPSNRLGGMTVTPALGQIARISTVPLDAAHFAISLQTAPGTWLQGTQQLATLCLAALTNQFSGLAPVQLTLVAATESSGLTPPTLASASASIAVLAGLPFLTLAQTDSLQAEVTLYGNLGSAYILQASPSLAGPWTPVSGLVLTNYEQSVLEHEPASGTGFFRAISATLPFVIATPAGAGQMNLALYGTPGLPYFVESSAAQTGPWTPLNVLVLTNSLQSFVFSNLASSAAFFQAVSASAPLLSATPGGAGKLHLTLYAIPDSIWLVESSASLAGPWTPVNELVLTNFSQTLDLPELPNGIRLFRAALATNPFFTAISTGPGGLQLSCFGALGSTNALQSSTSLTGPWMTVNTFILTNFPQSLSLNQLTNHVMFFRLEQE